MKNVTITLDEDTVAWARVRAAELDVSLSRFVGELLHQHMRESGEYQDAMQRYLSSTLVIRLQPGERPTARNELHDRPASRAK